MTGHLSGTDLLKKKKSQQNTQTPALNTFFFCQLQSNQHFKCYMCKL